MARVNKKGRNDNPGRVAVLPHAVLDTPAYLGLSLAARAILVELSRVYTSRNNGFIGLSVRQAVERCGIGKTTAARAIAELVAAGFVDVVTKGTFADHHRDASTYRLTWRACDRSGAPPSFRFRKIHSPVPVAGQNGTHGGTRRYP